jgi:hypothetical protein
MMSDLKCYECGKFISNKDFLSGKLKQVEFWSYDKTELEDVGNFCLKCTEKDACSEKATAEIKSE